jgi:hypothetical protein
LSKKPIAVTLSLLAISAIALAGSPESHKLINGTPLPFYVFKSFHSPENHYVPSGWMGDYRDLKFNDYFKPKGKNMHPHIQIVYSAQGTQGANWAGIYWQHPPNNWGNREGGYNLNGAKHLLFTARGEKGDEVIAEFKVGGIEGNYRDSGAAAIGPLSLTKDWKEYSIDLDGQELSSIAGGFCVTMNRDGNPKGATIYLDNIRFE